VVKLMVSYTTGSNTFIAKSFKEVDVCKIVIKIDSIAAGFLRWFL
jgi:hypothetical protein